MADESNGRKGTAASERARTRAASAPRDERGRFKSGGESSLPNPNPNGTASIDMMQLSFQETSTNYLQGIFEEISSLKKLLSSILVVNTNMMSNDAAIAQQDALTESRRRAAAEEEKREGRFAGTGGALRGAATTVKDRGKDLFAKFGGIGGLLSTIIGAGLLGAIFFPEKTKEMVDALQKGFAKLMNSEFFTKVEEIAKDIYDDFGWDNLLITSIFGWRIGAVYSGLEYVGDLIADWLGVPDANAMDEQEGGDQSSLPIKIKNWIGERFKDTFKYVALASILMPGAFWSLIKGSAWLVGKLLTSGMTGSALTAGMTASAAGDALPDGQKKAIEKGVKGARPGVIGNLLGRAGIKGIGILGMVYGISSLVSNIMADGEINEEDLNLENLFAGGTALAGAITAFAPGLVMGLLTPIMAFLLSPVGLAAIAAAVGAMAIAAIIDDFFAKGSTVRVGAAKDALGKRILSGGTGNMKGDDIITEKEMTKLMSDIEQTIKDDPFLGTEEQGGGVKPRIDKILKEFNKKRTEGGKAALLGIDPQINKLINETHKLSLVMSENPGGADDLDYLHGLRQVTTDPEYLKAIDERIKLVRARQGVPRNAAEAKVEEDAQNNTHRMALANIRKLTTEKEREEAFDIYKDEMGVDLRTWKDPKTKPDINRFMDQARKNVTGTNVRSLDSAATSSSPLNELELKYHQFKNMGFNHDDALDAAVKEVKASGGFKRLVTPGSTVAAPKEKFVARSIAMETLSKLAQFALRHRQGGAGQPIINSPATTNNTTVAKNVNNYGGIGHFVTIDSSAALVAGHGNVRQ